MKTTTVVKEGEVFTVVVHRATYRLSGEEDYKHIDVATNLAGKINNIEAINIDKEVRINIEEAIRVMNDDFIESLDKEHPYILYSIELIDQPI